MEKRHENELYARLERVFTHGVSEINKEELRLWFGVDRIAKGTWRKIKGYWEEITEGHHDHANITLFVGGVDSSNWVFIWGKGLTGSDVSWFQDVRYYTGDVDARGQLIAAEGDED